MIHYALQCDHGHAFDGWFASSDAFETQRTGGALDCPVCGSAEISRALMAPAVRTRATDAATKDEPAGRSNAAAPRTEVSSGAKATHAAVSDTERQQFIEAMRALRDAVVENGTDVGTDFPEEARRIHYGEAEPRGIYGKAGADEARALIEEGIKVLPLPALPEDHN